MDMATQTSTPRICVGLVGQSRAGKSTLLGTLLGNEHPGLTTPTERLSFAHARIYRCSSSDAPCYRSYGDHVDMAEGQCDSPGHEMDCMSVCKHVSFVDCPGMMSHVATMLTGIMMTDGVLVLSKPSVQFRLAPTCAVLAAASIMGKSIVVVQNCKEKHHADELKLEDHVEQIQKFTDIIVSKHVPIVSFSVNDRTNVDNIGEVCRHIINMPTPELDLTSPVQMIIADSCVTRGDAANEDETVTLNGRVLQGIIYANQEVEIRPGVMKLGDDEKPICYPIILKVVGTNDNLEHVATAGQIVALRATAKITDNERQQVITGGLGGHVLGQIGSLPGVYGILKIEVSLLPNMFNPYTEELEEVGEVENDQNLLLTIGAMSSYAKVRSISRDDVMTMIVILTPPSCASHGERIFISRQQELQCNLIGHGKVLAGKSVKVAEAS